MSVTHYKCDNLIALITQAKVKGVDAQSFGTHRCFASDLKQRLAQFIVDNTEILKKNAVAFARSQGLGGCFLGTKSFRQKTCGKF